MPRLDALPIGSRFQVTHCPHFRGQLLRVTEGCALVRRESYTVIEFGEGRTYAPAELTLSRATEAQPI